MLFFSALFGRIWHHSSSSWLRLALPSFPTANGGAGSRGLEIVAVGPSLPECEPPPPSRPAAIAVDVVAVNCRVLAIEHLLVVHAEAAVHQGAAVRAAAATRAMTTPAIPPHQNALRTPQVNCSP